eukprot:2038973-Pyramimonas_sp.AAC.1
MPPWSLSCQSIFQMSLLGLRGCTHHSRPCCKPSTIPRQSVRIRIRAAPCLRACATASSSARGTDC